MHPHVHHQSINNKMAVLTSRNNNDNAFEEHDDQTIKNDVRCCNNNDIRITTTNVRSNNNFKKRVSFHDSDLTTVHIVENLKRSLNRKERKQLWVSDHPSRKHIKIINKEIEDYESRLLMECFLFDNNSGSSNNSSKSICSNTSKPKRNRWYMKKKQ